MAKIYITSILILSILALPIQSFAQNVPLQIERFEPIGTPSSVLNIHNTRIQPHNVGQFSLFTHYTNSPYVLSTGDNIIARPIQHRLTTELAASISLFQSFELGLVVPLIYQKGDVFGDEDYSGFFIGDARITPKISFKNSQKNPGLGIGFALPLYLPLGRQDGLVGNKEVRIEPKLILDYSTEGQSNIALNLGFQRHDTRRINGYSQNDRIRIGLSGDTKFSELIGISGSVFSDLSTDDPEGDFKASPTFEAIAALKLDFSTKISTSIGGGIGLNQTIGVPLFRTFLSISFRAHNADRDGDGVSDSEDSCPDEPEDLDFFEDADGCPEYDNDKDGVPDLEDSCTNEPEDLDGFVDSDGCPDPDNDQDGLLDSQDSCPNAFGPEANNGCPQPLGEMGGDNPKISEKIKNVRVEIHACQTKLLERQPNSKGKFTIRFTINKLGKVVSTKNVENTLHEIFGKCVTNIINRIDFPKKEATVERRFIIDAEN